MDRRTACPDCSGGFGLEASSGITYTTLLLTRDQEAGLDSTLRTLDISFISRMTYKGGGGGESPKPPPTNGVRDIEGGGWGGAGRRHMSCPGSHKGRSHVGLTQHTWNRCTTSTCVPICLCCLYVDIVLFISMLNIYFFCPCIWSYNAQLVEQGINTARVRRLPLGDRYTVHHLFEYF